MIHNLKAEGLNITEIGRRLGLDRKTVRKYLHAEINDPQARQRQCKPSKLDRYKNYLLERLKAYPQLCSTRLLREIQQRGYDGGYTILGDYLRSVRPLAEMNFEIRYETPPGRQAQVDFAMFQTHFKDPSEVLRRIWLFTMVLSHSRYLWGQFCENQNLHTVLRMHMRAFEAFGGVPREVLYDRMKTAVIGEDLHGEVVYNQTLSSLLHHYGAVPRACAAYRPQTKGKVERVFRYVRQSFFMGSSFCNLTHLNECFAQWLDEVANVRCHGSTRRHVDQAFAQEQAHLTPLPIVSFRALLALERKVNKDGMICFDGNQYSVPDGTRSRILEVQALPFEVRIVDAGQVIACHEIPDGKGNQVLDPSHRKARPLAVVLNDLQSSSHPAQRPLDFYDAVGRRLASTSPVLL